MLQKDNNLKLVELRPRPRNIAGKKQNPIRGSRGKPRLKIPVGHNPKSLEIEALSPEAGIAGIHRYATKEKTSSDSPTHTGQDKQGKETTEADIPD